MAEITRKKAVELVLEYEKKQGRNPEMMNKREKGYHVKSGDRFIDVKIGNKNRDILINFSAFKLLGKEISKYYIYFVSGSEEKPKLKILEPDFILKNFSLLTLINLKYNLLKEISEEELQ